MQRGNSKFCNGSWTIWSPGVLGGTNGGKNKVKIKRKNKKDYVPEHLSKEQDIRLKKGDKVQVQTPGGGGFGNPKKRKNNTTFYKP